MSRKASGAFGEFWEIVKTLLWAAIIAIVIRTFAYEPFNIPSGSMIPTLLVGDYLFVSKTAYGYSKFSFPGGIVPVKGRIWEGAPKRGDVVVFRPPRRARDRLHQARDRPARRHASRCATASSTSTAWRCSASASRIMSTPTILRRRWRRRNI